MHFHPIDDVPGSAPPRRTAPKMEWLTIFLHQTATVVLAPEHLGGLVPVFLRRLSEERGPRVHPQQRFETFEISIDLDDYHSR